MPNVYDELRMIQQDLSRLRRQCQAMEQHLRQVMERAEQPTPIGSQSSYGMGSAIAAAGNEMPAGGLYGTGPDTYAWTGKSPDLADSLLETYGGAPPASDDAVRGTYGRQSEYTSYGRIQGTQM